MLVAHLPMIDDVTEETIQNSYTSNSVSVYDDSNLPTVSTGTDVNSPFGTYVSLSGSGDITFYFSPKMNKTTKFSMAFWFCKVSTLMTTGWYKLVAVDTYSSSGNTERFRLDTDNNATGYRIFNNGNFTDSGGLNNAGFNVPVGEWRHFAVSVDTVSGEFEQWVYNPNTGEEQHWTGVQSFPADCYFADSMCVGKPTQAGEIRYNDIRIYNHRISQYEVNEMRKRLMLHYPMDSLD